MNLSFEIFYKSGNRIIEYHLIQFVRYIRVIVHHFYGYQSMDNRPESMILQTGIYAGIIIFIKDLLYWFHHQFTEHRAFGNTFFSLTTGNAQSEHELVILFIL